MNSYFKSGRPASLVPVALRAAVALLSLPFLLPAFQANPPAPAAAGQSSAQAPKKKGSIEGTVLDAIAGKPVKDANLLITDSTGTGTPVSTKADENGHFVLKDLDAGNYVLIGDHPRYARQTYGSRNGLLGATVLTLTADQQMKDLVFKLQPNAVVSGKVLDEDKEPVRTVLVCALKIMYQHGKKMTMPVGTGITNDLGEYRIANLAPGRYFISASAMGPGAVIKGGADEPDRAFITTYYPNATEVSGAAPLDVNPGGEVGGMDIRIAKATSVRVSGKVAGAKAPQVSVRLIGKSAGLLAMITGPNATAKPADGTFEIAGATPGSYILRATDPTGMKPLGTGISLDVGDRKIEGIVLDASPAPELAGTVAVDGGDKVSLKGSRVILQQIEGLTMMPPIASLGEDGSFTFKDLPADRYLVRFMNGPKDYYVASVQLGQQEMPDDGFSLGGSAGKLTIKLRPGGPGIDGVVKGDDDKPMSGVTVALIPDNGKYLLYQTTFTDQNGAFSFKGLTPADYRVYAWEEVEPGAYENPEFVKPFESKAEKVSVKESEHKAVSLKAIPAR